MAERKKPESSEAKVRGVVKVSKTAAQLQLEARAAEKKRKMEQKSGGKKSHKQKVLELNQKLASMPDHFDLFRVSGGG